MALELVDFEAKARAAVQGFWGNRSSAMRKQIDAGKVDAGTRGAVTAGKNMDGFCALMSELVRANGLHDADILYEGRVMTLPGYFRPTKDWDMLIMRGSRLIAALEFKSQVGSFGNNFNNRVEEAIGTALDLQTALREGAFGENPPPFVGWMMLLEDAPGSRGPVKEKTIGFPMFPEFRGSSYADRYNILCKKLVQERLYDAASIILSPQSAVDGAYSEVSDLTGLRTFVTNFAGHIAAEAARPPSGPIHSAAKPV
jgi:hypothetical protein